MWVRVRWEKTAGALFAFAFIVAVGRGGSPGRAAPAGVGPLVWADEFDGPALNDQLWSINEPGVWSDAVNTPDAVSVADGVLTLKTWTDPDAGTHYNAVLGTQDHFLTTYGYFEARVRFHSSPGMWSAFWLNSPTIGRPLGDPGKAGTEIDVVEHRATNDVGKDVTGRYLAAVHWDGYGPEHQFEAETIRPPPGDLANGVWHTYGVRWAPDGYTFYYDDQPVWSWDQAVSHAPQYLLLSSEVWDGSWAGHIPEEGYGSYEESTTNMQVDAVRVYRAFAGDANLDGRVDVTDLAALATHFGTPEGAGLSQGDFDGDGAVTAADLGILATLFGSGTSDPAPGAPGVRAALAPPAAAVPEPGAAGLSALAALAAAALRQRKRRPAAGSTPGVRRGPMGA